MIDSENIIFLFLDFLFTFIGYLFFPFIYAQEGKVSKKKGKKIALWNSIICEIIFTSIGFAINGATAAISFAQGIFYYFIAKKILIDPELEEDISENEKLNDADVLVDSSLINENLSEEMQIINNPAISPYNDAKNSNDNFSNNEMIEIEKSPLNNTQKTYKIKKLQKIMLFPVCVLLIFCIVFPIIINYQYKDIMPSSTSSYNATISLNKLDSNKKAYYENRNHKIYLFIKNNNGKLRCYIFNKQAKSNLESYFGSNLNPGMPPISFALPYAIPTGISVLITLLFVIILLSIYIHKYSEEQINYLTKNDETFIALKNEFKNDNISIREYKKKLKKLFSEKIIENNTFFKIFTFLY